MNRPSTAPPPPDRPEGGDAGRSGQASQAGARRAFVRGQARRGPVSCPTCRLHLELHQPDPGWPDRLLGTCSGCRGWVVVDLIPGRSPAIGPVPPPPGGDPRPGLAGPLLPDGDDPL